MCGRFGLRFPDHPDLLALGLYPPPGTTPRDEIAPTQPVLALLETGGQRRTELLRWGLIPSWAKDPHAVKSTFNARAETVAEKPTFRSAFKARRCLIPADVFYEWQALPGAKRKPKYAIARRDGRPFWFARLWEMWGREGSTIASCTIITTTPNAIMAPIHDRMPVIIEAEDAERWLDPSDHGEPAGISIW